ncbi:MAG: hypothetical protein NDI94_01780 [Candidatus Woesearchaeota archaeon]|nr:hypothetical protein [Candidatus Woesearchaeota archaeon]
MPKKSKKRDYKILYLIFKIILIALVIKLSSTYRSIVLLFLFEIIDVWKTILRRTIPFIPIDFEFIFGITASYFFSPVLGVVIFIMSLINRFLLLSIEPRHIVKIIRHPLLFFGISFMGSIPFFWAAFIMLGLNYLLKFLLNAVFLDETPEKMLYHGVNFTASTIIFYLIHMLHFYVSFIF